MEYFQNLSLNDLKEYVNGIGWVKERWKDILGYEKEYAVSTFGRVYSYSKMVWQPQKGKYVKRKERILRQKKCSDGYLAVTLQTDGVRRYTGVHRLVALMFVKNDKNKPQVNHKFGDKKDNRPQKLEWVTCKENINHAIQSGVYPRKGEGNGRSLLTEQIVREMRKNYVRKKQGYLIEMSNKYGISVRQAGKICRREAWGHLK